MRCHRKRKKNENKIMQCAIPIVIYKFLAICRTESLPEKKIATKKEDDGADDDDDDAEEEEKSGRKKNS